MNTKKPVLFVKLGSILLAFMEFSCEDLLPRNPNIIFIDVDDLQPFGSVASLKL